MPPEPQMFEASWVASLTEISPLYEGRKWYCEHDLDVFDLWLDLR